MPEMDGFEVLENLELENMPTIIFVTAYCDYALKAFEVHALDYLLKPFDEERLGIALVRARRQIEGMRTGEFDEKLRSLLSDIKPQKQHPERLLLKTAGRVYFVKIADIDWIEAAGNYVKLILVINPTCFERR